MNFVYALLIVVFVNFLFSLFVALKEYKTPAVMLVYLLIVMLVPFFGFIFYVVVCQSPKTNKFCLNLKKYSGQVISSFQEIKFYSFGKSLYEDMLQDFRFAEHSINIEMYIFSSDSIGKKIVSLLTQKAKEGVKVKLIYDRIGSFWSKKSIFNSLKKAGGECICYGNNLKMNYRSHKKLAVIDGKIGYMGGINIRDDHLGRKKSLSPWRDTHARFTGEVVSELQKVFFVDYYIKKRVKTPFVNLYQTYYFLALPKTNQKIFLSSSHAPSQIAELSNEYVRLISLAKNSIVIETPYFIPTSTILVALENALKRKVKLTILLPKKPDKKRVFLFSLFYLAKLKKQGACVMFYDGFLHSKIMLVDDSFLLFGSCNFDCRSFALNYETIAVLSCKKQISSYRKIIESDLKNSVQGEMFAEKKKMLSSSLFAFFVQLFSPIL